jgi:hypothetical protein
MACYTQAGLVWLVNALRGDSSFVVDADQSMSATGAWVY